MGAGSTSQVRQSLNLRVPVPSRFSKGRGLDSRKLLTFRPRKTKNVGKRIRIAKFRWDRKSAPFLPWRVKSAAPTNSKSFNDPCARPLKTPCHSEGPFLVRGIRPSLELNRREIPHPQERVRFTESVHRERNDKLRVPLGQTGGVNFSHVGRATG